jgi:hypothetical protein
VRACAPPAAWLTIVVIVVRAAEGTKASAEMTAVETMAAAKASPVAATEPVTAAAVAATTAANQHEWVRCWTHHLLLRPADTVRLCERGSGGTRKSKHADKTRRD